MRCKVFLKLILTFWCTLNVFSSVDFNCYFISWQIAFYISIKLSFCIPHIFVRDRAIASLTVIGGQEFHFSHSFLKFRSIFLILPQTFLIFFLILALRVRPPGKTLTTPLDRDSKYLLPSYWKLRIWNEWQCQWALTNHVWFCQIIVLQVGMNPFTLTNSCLFFCWLEWVFYIL